MTTFRTFIAVPLPDSIVSALERLRGRLEPDMPGARWVDGRNLHVTLAFLGDVPVSDLDALCHDVAEAVAPVEPFETKVEGIGAFPDARRPRVVWAGLTGAGADSLVSLQRVIAEALRLAGHTSDEKFSPHVTLARFKPGRYPPPDLTRVLDRHKTWTGGSFQTSEVIVFRSDLSAGKPSYAPLAHCPMKLTG